MNVRNFLSLLCVQPGRMAAANECAKAFHRMMSQMRFGLQPG